MIRKSIDLSLATRSRCCFVSQPGLATGELTGGLDASLDVRNFRFCRFAMSLTTHECLIRRPNKG